MADWSPPEINSSKEVATAAPKSSDWAPPEIGQITSKKEKATAGEKATGYGVGLVSGIAGTPGEAIAGYKESMAKGPSWEKAAKFLSSVPTALAFRGAKLPTAKDIQQKLIPEPKAEVKPYITAGEYTPLAAGLGTAGYQLGKTGLKTAGKLAKSFKAPEPVAKPTSLESVGKKIEPIQDIAQSEFAKRSSEAKVNYDAALDAARTKQAQGKPFASSQEGQNLLRQLEKDKYVIAGDKRFVKGEEQVKGIDRLINAIKGITTGGKEVPVGKGEIARTLTKTTPKVTTEKDISALIEELRFLRDIDAQGKPYEAYAALNADYKRNLIKKFEDALYRWNPEYYRADQAYKEASQRLRPFQTKLMQGALKGEKFDLNELVKAPEEFGKLFFNTADSVRQLKGITKDPAYVNNVAKEYVATILENKSPTSVKTFAYAPENEGWMRESGILQDVRKYADQANKAESRQKMLKYLGYGVVGAGVGSAGAGYVKNILGGF
jgi:hypothetical protein